ncbi:hypothetical protein P692DRAFT_20748486, partial [Suillus brevipes Sb2]
RLCSTKEISLFWLFCSIHRWLGTALGFFYLLRAALHRSLVRSPLLVTVSVLTISYALRSLDGVWLSQDFALPLPSSSKFQSISAKFALGYAKSSPLVRYLQANVSHLLFR